MRSVLRFRPRPALVLSLAALFFALGGSAFALTGKSSPQQRCQTGAVRGIAVVTGDPLHGIQNLPGQFSGAARFFARRFNCAGGPVQVRKLGAGTYAVRFVGLANASVVASPLSADASGAAVQQLPDGSFQVTLHGTDTPQNHLPPVDVSFVVVAF